jgi:hypothetical protein
VGELPPPQPMSVSVTSVNNAVARVLTNLSETFFEIKRRTLRRKRHETAALIDGFPSRRQFSRCCVKSRLTQR